MQTLKMVNMIVIVENLHFCLCQLECDIPRTLCVYLSEGVHQPTFEHNANGATLSVVVMEMTDATAGGKTCEKYYGVFGVV